MTSIKAFLLGLLGIGFATTAQAELQICNDTSSAQHVSIGYKGDTEWTSEGWWKIEPSKCATLVSGDLKKRYYYYRAEVGGGEFTGEDYYFCTHAKEYTIEGDQDCVARGYEREKFSEIDTGKTSKDFTFNLSQEIADAQQSTGETGLFFCNNVDKKLSVSVGYKKGDDVFSEGWWNIEPGDCSQTLAGDLQTQLYYYRAEIDGGEFEGTVHFCTSPEEYTIEQNDNCAGRNYDREAFAEIDTGSTSRTYTHNITHDMMEVSKKSSDLGLTICNETKHTQSVSIGYEGDAGFTSEGWWHVDANECKKVISTKLKLQYYYYRAEVQGGDFDGENYFFCTDTKEYTIVGDEDCGARGYDRESFREINTGSSPSSYTLTLVGQ
jgi:uncharacterized membrane protein